jgi:hypothetical protein
MGNTSYDEDFGVNAVETLTYNPVSGNLERMSGIQGNASFVLTRNGSGYITSIAMTIGSATYTKTITRDGSNYITNISVWT